MVDAAIIGGLLTNLAPLIRDEFSLFSSFKKDVDKLSNTLSSLNATLKDAETKNLSEKDNQIEDWLRKLKVVAYEVRDIMDECTFEDLRFQVKRLNASYSSCWIQVFNHIAHPLRNTSMRLKIRQKIKDVSEKLENISSERKMFQLTEINPDLKPETFKVVRETMSLLSVEVHGRDEECKEIVEILVNSFNDDKRLSILSIIGIGGLGKTTLAQMVFKDEKIDEHFDKKIWVCISEDFDINRVMRDIIGDKSEATLETLQIKIRTQLNGKRYLIVLDDVWNEDENEWDKLRSALDCGSDGAVVLATTRKKLVAEKMKTKQHFELSPLSYHACWLLFKERAFRNKTSENSNLIDIGRDIAAKCKGIPLVAKTLGGLLGFKNDEEDWRKIRDNEIWEISQIENGILPILRLSYYDLPYHLRRCFAFCAILPKDTEIEKKKLIQLWMAHDLIPINKNKEGENYGNTIWDELCWRSFFQDEKEKSNWFGKVQTCKMHDLMHDLAHSIMKDECYTMDDKNSSEDFGREIRHIIVMMVEITKTSIDSLRKKRGLQSLILHPRNHITFSKEIFSVLKELSSLRVLEVSRLEQSEDLCYVGGLKHLRYLDLSSSYQVKTLPNSICDLLNLQTLKLNDCNDLESLPRNMKDLINLQHLYLDGCNKLRYMPGGMGRLKGLKTLSLVVVGKNKRDCQLDEFKELEIGGCLEIRNLERVSEASIERGISMAKMSSIYKLELEWKDNDETNSRHEKIGEALEVSSSCLKRLKMKGYKGMNIPKLVEKSSATLTKLHLSALDNVEHVFTSAISNDMNEMVFMSFPLLEELYVDEMKNLRELVSPPISMINRAFPNLRKIDIDECPKLGALPPPHHLKSLKEVYVEGGCSDELFDSILDLSGQLTRLFLTDVKERIVIFPGVGSRSSNDMNGTVAPLLEELCVSNMENLRELVSPPRIHITTGSFPNLGRIEIYNCPKLGALPPPHDLKSLKVVKVNGECTDELLYSISNLSALTHLTLWNMKERSVLFGGGDNDDDKISSSSTLAVSAAEAADNNNNNINERGGGAPAASSSFQSLRLLDISKCDKLSCLFDEKLARGDCLKNLDCLYIWGCPELMISVEQWRNITYSLQRLWIVQCPKLVPSSKVEEAEEVIALLRSLRERLGPDKFKGDILKEEEQRAI